MGLIKDVKAQTAGTDASRAAAERRTVFLYRFNAPATSSGFSAIRALVHSSPAGRTLVIYRGAAFQGVVITTTRSGC